MNAPNLRLDFTCELHPLPILSYCRSCDLFLCNQCGKSHPKEHQEMISSDLKRIVYEKVSYAMEYQESRKRGYEQYSIAEKIVTLLIQKLADCHITIKAQMKELQEQTQKDKELVQMIGLMQTGAPLKKEHQDRFFRNLRAARPPLTHYLDQQQGLLGKLDLLATTLNKEAFELPKYRQPAVLPEGNGVILAEKDSNHLLQNNPPNDLPPMLFFFDNQSGNPRTTDRRNDNQTMQLERSSSQKSSTATSTINLKETARKMLLKSGGKPSPVPHANNYQIFSRDPSEHSNSMKISIPKKPVDKKPDALESPGLKNDLAAGNLDPPMSLTEKVKKSTKHLPPIYQDRNLLLDMLRKHAPKLVQSADSAKGQQDRVSQQALNQFLYSPAQQSMLENLPLPPEWRDIVELLLVESGKLQHRRSRIDKNATIIIVKMEQILSTSLDQDTPEKFGEIIQSIPTIADANAVLAEIMNSLIALSPEELQRYSDLCRLLSWMQGFFEEFNRLQKLQPREFVNADVTRMVLRHLSRSINSIIKRVNKPNFNSTRERNIWAALAGVLVSLRVCPSKLWSRLAQAGNALESQKALPENCPILKGINNFVEDRQFLMACYPRLIEGCLAPEQRSVSASLFLNVLNKQRALDRISRTPLPEALRKLPLNYSEIIKTYRMVISAWDPTYMGFLKQQLNMFPYKLPEIENYVNSVETKAAHLVQLINEHATIPPIDWKALTKSSEEILKLSAELKQPLQKKLEQKLLLISSISKNPAISGALRTDTKYQQIIIAKQQIEELSHVESYFIPQNKFFRISLWLSTVRLIKAVLDGKIEKLEPLLSEAEVRELEKEGHKLNSKSPESQKDLSEKQDLLAKLIKSLDEKLQQLEKINNPEEWWWFDHDLLGVVDLSPHLEKKKAELLNGKFQAKDFEEPNTNKIELVKAEAVDPVTLDDFVPELDLVGGSKKQ